MWDDGCVNLIVVIISHYTHISNHYPVHLVCVVCSVTQSCPTFCEPMDCSHQPPPSMEFSRQECWSGLPFPSPGDLPNPGIEPTCAASPVLAGKFFTTTEPPGKSLNIYHFIHQLYINKARGKKLSKQSKGEKKSYLILLLHKCFCTFSLVIFSRKHWSNKRKLVSLL